MPSKEPVLLVVLIETGTLRWFVAGIDLAGEPIPLLRSEEGNLRPYLGVELDEQVSFLRHRLAGVLQRGCDRLWGQVKKPCQIVFVADAPFPEAAPDLGERVGRNFAEWMSRPPVVYCVNDSGFAAESSVQLQTLAGTIEESHREPLAAGLPRLWLALETPDDWELAPSKTT